MGTEKFLESIVLVILPQFLGWLREKRQSKRRAMTPHPPTDWLTAKEAAAYLKVRRRTLLAWTRQGKIRGYRLSGTLRCVWRFKQADLDATMSPSSAAPADMEAA